MRENKALDYAQFRRHRDVDAPVLHTNIGLLTQWASALLLTIMLSFQPSTKAESIYQRQFEYQAAAQYSHLKWQNIHTT